MRLPRLLITVSCLLVACTGGQLGDDQSYAAGVQAREVLRARGVSPDSCSCRDQLQGPEVEERRSL